MDSIVLVGTAPDTITVIKEQTVVTEQESSTVILAGQIGPPGPAGPQGESGGATVTGIAAGSIGGGRVVAFSETGKITYASCDSLFDASVVLGITNSAAIANDPIYITRSGEITDSSWNWIPKQPIYLGINGVLTQTLPPTAKFSLVVAIPATTTKIFVTIREPIVLAQE